MNHFQQFIESLKVRIKHPLPGWEAQQRMASLRRFREGNFFNIPENARTAGVLVLVYPVEDAATIVFIRRNEYDGVHSGQVSFPGGQMENGDRSVIDTALREAWEETGIRKEEVEIIGELTSLYIPPSNFRVYPVLGYSLKPPVFSPDKNEVQHIIEIGIERLKEPSCRTVKEVYINEGNSVTAPCYYIDQNVIWGATAMILSEFLELT